MQWNLLNLLMVLAMLLMPAGIWAQAPEVAVELPGGVPLEMVWIEPGTFVMGGEPDLVAKNSTNGPQHIVTLTKGFYLGKFEVTQAQWTALMGTKLWEPFEPDCLNCPTTDISWENAQEFLHQLNLTSDDSIRYRLPTEAEWEYAARAGTNTAWSFGDELAELTDYAWYRDNSCFGEENTKCSSLPKVGLKLPNPWGLYDMHGNVYEWVEDWWTGPYPEGQQVDPVNDVTPVLDDPDLTPGRIFRGGSYARSEVTTRSGIRNWEDPRAIIPDRGFRIAASLSTETHAVSITWGTLKTRHQSSTRDAE